MGQLPEGCRDVDERDENNIYLIREMDSNEAIHRWVKRNFDKLFTNEPQPTGAPMKINGLRNEPSRCSRSGLMLKWLP